MPLPTCLIGFDRAEAADLAERLSSPCVAHEMPPCVVLRDGTLSVESPLGGRFEPVARVVFHGIFENDLDLLAALALWGGPCFPNPAAMMDCRLRLPCLVRALRYSKFAPPPRGFASAGAVYETDAPAVAKWGDWHCGENKEVFRQRHASPHARLVEPYFAGEAVRVLMLGERAWQIRMTGPDWKKSVHGTDAKFVDIDPELLADTRAIRAGFGLDVIANDYIVGAHSKHLLEVNHIPSVTCLPGLWEAYVDLVSGWDDTTREK